MLSKARREKKPRSRLVRQIHATGALIILLQCIGLLIGIEIFIARGRAEIEAVTESLAIGSAEVVGETHPTNDIREIVRISQDAMNNSDQVLNTKAITAIVTSESYQRTHKAIQDFRPPSDDYNITLVGYDKDNENNVFIADATQDLGDVSRVGTVIDLPEQLYAEIQDQEPNASYTLLTSDGDIVAMSARYLVEGDPTAGIVVVSSAASQVVQETAFIILVFAVGTLVVDLFMLYFLNSRSKKFIVSPLNTITEAIRRYSSDRSSGNVERKHFDTLGIETNNEFETLAETLSKMELDVSHYVEEMARITAEQEREEAELRMAARIQESALPSVFPAFPDRSEFSIYASMTPAREVGGDFYDFFLVDDDHLCMVIADVSDKGIPAALFMMTCKTTIANHVMAGKSPAKALTDANKAICKTNTMGMFVTVWVGILELSTGRLTAANAGHEYPVVQRPHGRFALYRDRHGLMVGSVSSTQYTDYRITLRPGSKLFVYTDGVPEATDANTQMFGLDRMVDALNQDKNAEPKEVLANIHRAVDEFMQDEPQFDDLTMLCVEYKGRAR